MAITVHPSACFNSLRPVAATLPPPGFDCPQLPDFSPSGSQLRALKMLAMAAVGVVAALASAEPRTDSTPNQRAVAAPQLKLGETGDATRWHHDSVEVTLDPSLEDLGPDALDAVRNAFGTWIETEAKLPSIAFNTAKHRKDKAKQDGVNRVLAAPITIPGHENDLAITVSYVSSSGEILEADMIINTNVEYHADDDHDCSKKYDLRNVVTHESGHFFGLGEDIVDPDGTMYFKTSRCETKKRTLTQPDVVTVASLYEGSPNDEMEPGVSCSVTAVPSTSNLAPLWLAAIAALGVACRRRRG